MRAEIALAGAVGKRLTYQTTRDQKRRFRSIGELARYWVARLSGGA
jgi:hypothetical protein